MLSSSKVIKASDSPVVNPFGVDQLIDLAPGSGGRQSSAFESFAVDTEKEKTAGSPAGNASVSEIPWTTGKFAGARKGTPNQPVQPWTVSDFRKDVPAPLKKAPEQSSPAQQSAFQADEYARILEDAGSKADELISSAEKQAEEIIARANSEAEAIKQRTFTEGMAAARNEMSDTLQQAARIFQESQLWQEQMMHQSQSRLMDMVLAIGKKLFGGGFELPPEQLDHIVSRAINEASRLGNLRVYLHPEDAKKLVNLWQESELTVNGQQIQIVSSQNISRGGCFIDGQFGVLDARVEEQLDQINRSIKSTEVNLEIEK